VEQKLRPRRADLEFLATVAHRTGEPMSAILRRAWEAWVATPDGAPWRVSYVLAKHHYDRDPATTGFGRRPPPSSP
jgi:hypothetical protein